MTTMTDPDEAAITVFRKNLERWLDDQEARDAAPPAPGRAGVGQDRARRTSAAGMPIRPDTLAASLAELNPWGH